ncbi:CPBP family intramembrane glutamic endopeptidase [Micromonospora sp. DT81.3]|uniref:CPBP family intramembrane glutamic endopeptidase n=1 Tax=Micromonospora sp. DT81.3 TaxID=3416523 RepID=UPI003CF25718
MTAVHEPVELAGGGIARRWVSRHPLVSFFLLSYAVSWTLWGIATVGGGRVAFLLGGFGPLAAALCVTRLTGASVRGWLRTLLVWRVSFGYYLIALLLPVAIYAVINLVLLALGYSLNFDSLAGLAPAYFGTFLLVATVGGGLEEPGWRGFALPRLQKRHSPVLSTLVVGLAWGIWHVPLYGPAGFVVPMILAFFYTWLYNRTGSILICLLLHAAFTPAQNFLTFAQPTNSSSGGLGDTSDLVILGVYVLAVVGLTLATRGRLGLAADAARDLRSRNLWHRVRHVPPTSRSGSSV